MIAHVECLGEYLLDNQDEGKMRSCVLFIIDAASNVLTFFSFFSTPFLFLFLLSSPLNTMLISSAYDSHSEPSRYNACAS